MIILRNKYYSAQKSLLNTNSSPLFIKNRKYDTDFDRLGRLKTQREMTRVGDLYAEQRKMKEELRGGLLHNLNKE